MSRRAGWIWGRHPVLEALRAGQVTIVLLASDRVQPRVLDEIRALAAQQHVPVRLETGAEVDRVTPGRNSQGVVAQVRENVRADLGQLLTLEPPEPMFLLALDQVQDPQNLGALLRTGEAAGVHGVIVPARRSAGSAGGRDRQGAHVPGYGGAVAKASAGAVSHLRIARVPNLVQALDAVRRSGIWTIGLDGDAPSSIYDTDLTVPLILVIGNEGAGLRRLTREHCDVLAHLPMRGEIASLNASAAGAVAMYEVVRQRGATMVSMGDPSPT